MPSPRAGILDLYTRPRMLAVTLLGLASGLPLALTASTLSIWLAEAGVSKAAIGLLAAVGIPYTLKFLWSPLIDALSLGPLTRRLGRRRGWLLLTEAALMAFLLLLGMSDPARAPLWTGILALCVAAASATQDIVLDAYRVEWLRPEEQAAGAASFVFGYRLGMIVSSAGALYLATFFGWKACYAIMALIVPLGFLVTLRAGEPDVPQELPQQRRGLREFFRQAVHAPFADFTTRAGWLHILLFVLFYKLGDAFIGVMTNPFLIETGFSKIEIANVVKFYGLIATIAGGFLGGAMAWRIGLVRTLWICGIAQALTNLLFMAQARIGADLSFLALVITAENLSGGMSTAAFVAYLSRLCNLRFTATQYALLSSFAAFGRTWLSTPAGAVAKEIGWEGFFAFSALLALPGLLLLHLLVKKGFVSGLKQEG